MIKNMEPRFSLRNVLLSVLRCKLMKDEETRAWEELIDLFDEKHLAQLWDMFAVENTELSGALKSLDDYLQYFHACEERRQTWLHTIEHEDAGLTFAVTSVLQSKRHWTGPQIDEAFKTDASVCTFLAGLSIRDLEQMRKVIDLHDQAGEYDDEDGKPTKARNTLIGIVTFLQEDAWNAEQKEAEELQPILQNIASAEDPLEQAKALSALGFLLRTKHKEFGNAHKGKSADNVLLWSEHQPKWFTMTWEQVKEALEAAALTVNVSATLAGLGVVTSRVLAQGLWTKLEELARRS
ncbi:hypothetical protein A2881_04840 [Candidatus Peribacteria bacterium RIFCSPHIGHO2_01_FULL_55_13]|nr:MAG: hypothetical protein A2881_04840 [Candidatus Peribacteria bacterium RIFCSPHIGHO2_01_FULL_55_13]